MTVSETTIQGAFLIDLDSYADERGALTRLWCSEEFGSQGLSFQFVQLNQTLTLRRGTIRGLHYQVSPFGEIKFVSCLKGALYDVLVDVRPESVSYARCFGVDLNASEPRALLIPEGVAHGFQTTVDRTEIIYASSAPHHHEAERGIRWSDPSLDVAWPFPAEAIVSEKDHCWKDFQF